VVAQINDPNVASLIQLIPFKRMHTCVYTFHLSGDLIFRPGSRWFSPPSTSTQILVADSSSHTAGPWLRSKFMVGSSKRQALSFHLRS